MGFLVLNIGKLAAGGEGYYLGTVAAGVEDYYTGAGEAPGYWLGAAATGLGLAGQVSAADLRAVLGGADPQTGERLGSFKSGRTVPGFDLCFRAPKSVSLLWALGDEDTARQAREAHDAAVAGALGYLEDHAGYCRRGVGGVEAVRIGGFAAAAFRHRSSRAGDPLLHTHVLVANVGQAVDDGAWRTLDARRLYAHAKTAGCLYQAALRAELTRRLGVEWAPVRNGAADLAGMPRELIEAFSQRRAEITARLAARGESSAKAAQTATLATRKRKDYGVEPASLHQGWQARAAALGWGPARNRGLLGVTAVQWPDPGELEALVVELAGPGGLTARASTFARRDVIQAWCARLRHGGQVDQVQRLADALLAGDAGVAVRLLPAGHTPEAAAEADQVGPVIDAAAAAVGGGAGRQLRDSAALRRAVAVVLAATDWAPEQVAGLLLARELATAEDPAAVVVWRAQRLAAAVDPEAAAAAGRLTAAAAIRRGDGQVVAVDGDEPRHSTPELLALEQRLIAAAVSRQGEGVAQAPDEAVAAALARRPSISGEQAAMVRRLTSSGAGVEVVVGKAGAGKTYALDAARDAWQAVGVRVVGAALAARAADELEAAAGVDSYTVDGLLGWLDRADDGGGGLAAGSVVVVDEAAMVGTRKLARLLDHAAAARAKVVLVGDHHQLPEIDAGGVFRGLAQRLAVIELADNRRQRHAWERAALDQLRAGEPAAAVAAWDAAGRIWVGDSADAVREQLVADWWAAHQTADDGGEAGVMIAARVADVEDLNARARARLAAAGALRGPALVAGQRDFRRGDRVVCLRNDRRLGVKNGTRGTVTSVDVARGSLQLAVDGGASVTVGSDYVQDGHLAHGYALTGHKAQGITCQQAWVLGSDQLYREWGYTALSRHREAARLYIVGDVEPEADQHPHTLAQPDGDPIAELTRALERSRGQRLAIDHADPHQLVARGGAEHAQPPAAGGQRDSGQETNPWPGPRTHLEAPPRDGAVEQCPPGQAHHDEHGARWSPDASLDTAMRRSVQAAEFDPPLYLQHAIGPRPDDPDRRRGWRAAAAAIERYRTLYDQRDPVQALGERPSGGPQRIAYDLIAQAVSAARTAEQDTELAAALGRDGPQLAG